HNHGQLDIHTRLIFPMPDLTAVFTSFGWNVSTVDATAYDGVFAALEAFRSGTRNGKPTAIVCKSTKGFGAFSDVFNPHQVTVPDEVVLQETRLETDRRQARVDEFTQFVESLDRDADGAGIEEQLLASARRMHLEVTRRGGSDWTVRSTIGPVLTRRVPARD